MKLRLKTNETGLSAGFAIRSPDTLPVKINTGKRPSAGAGSLQTEFIYFNEDGGLSVKNWGKYSHIRIDVNRNNILNIRLQHL